MNLNLGSNSEESDSSKFSFNKNSRFFFLVFIIFGLAVFLRSDLSLLPMNDEVLYVVASTQRFFEITENKQFSLLSAYDITEMHPPLARYIFGLGCFITNCSQPIFNLALFMWLPSVPHIQLTEVVKTVLVPMRFLSFLLSLVLLLVVFHYMLNVSKKSALVGSFIVATSPNIALYSNVVMLDLAYALFTTVFLLFYLKNYWEQRTANNAAIMGILLALALLTKLYLPFLALGPVLILETWRAWKKKNIDFKLLGGTAFGLVLFKAAMMFLSHYNPKPETALILDISHFQKNLLDVEMIWLTLARMEIMSLILLPLAILAVYNASKNSEILENFNARVGLAILFFSLPLFLFSVENSYVRYALPVFPLLAVFVSSTVEKVDTWKKALVALLVLASLSYAMFHYPYYDNYSNPLSYLHRPVLTERETSLTLLKFLANETGQAWTNDNYQFPYYLKLNFKHVISLVQKNPWQLSSKKGYLLCSNMSAFESAMLAENRTKFIYSKSAPFEDCPALKPMLEKRFQIIYLDDYYEVFDLTKKKV